MPISRKHPVTYVVKKGAFPEGPYREGTPWEVYLAAGLANRLKTKMKGESIRYVARQAQLDPQTLINILKGRTWPDLLTVARLEHALEAKLWGNEHRKGPIPLDCGFHIPPGFETPPLKEQYEVLLASNPAAAKLLVLTEARWREVAEHQRVATLATPTADTSNPPEGPP